ncbi:MAG TPA: hypothetical protein ENN60_03585 [archaeon]|nr:hypothetical protein [archaeon]
MILEWPPADGEGKRLCPKCGNEAEGTFCDGCNLRSIREGSPLAIYGRLREEAGLPFFGGFFPEAIYGYDLRFIVAKTPDLEAEATRYAEAFRQATKPGLMIVSVDQRSSGSLLKQAFLTAARESGTEAVGVEGMLSTTSSPFLGAMASHLTGQKILLFHCTASHNPPAYNGFKVFHGDFKADMFPTKLEIQPEIHSDRVHQTYATFLLKRFGPDPSKIPFTFDFMHGVGWEVLKHVFPQMAPKVKVLRTQPFEDFGGMENAQPPPVHEGQKGLSFCADGDMDRIVMYHHGKYIPMSRFLAILAELGAGPDQVVMDQRLSPVVRDFLTERGVGVIMGGVGRAVQEFLGVKHRALWTEDNWHSGGYEADGVKFFWPEGPLCLMDWLKHIENTGVNQFFEGRQVPETFYHQVKLAVSPNMNEKVKKMADGVFTDAVNVEPIGPEDGVNISFKDSHMLIRESNTECGSLRVEATALTPEGAERLAVRGVRFVEKLRVKK